MAHLPKVEVFQLSITKVGKNNTVIAFGELMKRIVPREENEELDDDATFSRFFSHFIRRLDTETYFKDLTKKKAITVYQQNEDDTQNAINNTITSSVSENIIQGIIKGGSFGRKRFRSNINLKNDIDEISSENVIGDDFYFLLYTPLDFHCGILMIQSYQDSSIRDTFLKFIKQIFNISTHRVKPKQFLPQKYETMFNDSYLLKNVSFSSTFNSNDISGSDDITEENNDYDVRIIVTPKNRNISGMGDITRVVSDFVSTTFSNRELDNFDKKRVNLGNEGSVRGAYFDLGDSMKIRPVIYLAEIDIDENSIPDFNQIKSKCNEILEEVKEEIYPS